MITSTRRSRRFSDRMSAVIKREKIIEGTLKVIEEFCKGCNFCIEFCPVKALEKSDRFSVKGIHPPELKSKEQCIGCGLCEAICPDFAIYLEKSEGEERR